MLWLLEEYTLKRLNNLDYKAPRFSLEDEEKFYVSSSEAGGRDKKIFVEGLLTQRKNFMSMMLGLPNTTYSQIIEMIELYNNDPEVQEIELVINSPGGEFDGLFDVVEVIKASKKPIKSFVTGMAASAAYAIAAQTSKITAKSYATRVGSIGVVASFYRDEKEITIASSNAPNKAPDVGTPEGRGVVRTELDELEDLFLEHVADSRKTTKEKVIESYGQGSVFLAKNALKRGMIDAISDKKTQSFGGLKLMSLEKTYEDGIAAERDRVVAHLIMGEKSGAMDVASQAIKDGSFMTSSLQATYLSAAMDRSAHNARVEDSVELKNVSRSDGDLETGSERVLAILEDRMGVRI
jgi:ClpP class serine protease